MSYLKGGVGKDVRSDLMDKCNLHTILRLPTGIFYAAGVKTNVLFFTKGSVKDKLQEENCTENTWIYDLRTNMPNFGKRTPFGENYLRPFELLYGDDTNGESPRKAGEWSFTEQGKINDEAFSRWQCFSRDDIRDTKKDSLDISWIKDKNSVDAADLGTPEELATEAMLELKGAIGDLEQLLSSLGIEVNI
jgi:type I restriction enzyme M protein